MKAFIRFIVIVIITSLLSSCDYRHVSDKGSTSNGTTIHNEATGNKSSGASVILSTKTKTVLYTPPVAHGNITSSEKKATLRAPQISITIPSDWTGTSGNFKHYDRRTSSYTTVLEIGTPIQIEDDFTPSKDMLHLFGYDKKFSQKLISSATVTTNTTSDGYGYYAFTASNAKTDMYLMIAFVVIDDNIILPLSFVLPYEDKVVADMCMNSIKVHTKSSP